MSGARVFGHWRHTTRQWWRCVFVVHVVASTDFIAGTQRYRDGAGDLTYCLGLGWLTINVYPVRVPTRRRLQARQSAVLVAEIEDYLASGPEEGSTA